MGCIDEMDYKILLPSSSIKECADFIKKNFKEIYYVNQGYRIFNTYLIGISPIPVAVDDDYVIMPYVKPCHGSFVLKIKGKEEVKRLRAGK
ncbi:hypothetical protein ANME2D_03277 [Candidatus Methanoperedens nitroreducens]|uniref:DUF1894 domain-containing protein n=1 Tax=Candidatus Methanoperedens nitratireducens TaxID=1392998 RepID=A0A062UYW8_9EURY|nr:DUF1894 domain-containing protein [Candidatus Methanoperedens nitroreducens]KCZ70362.1 hypothetical protein ANME2D_03277 [Candidatus Methanoperedens nitroreducens]MDJ1420801.1 DUF1894 domain-containing protein [Candidatus Methanoperedens sp.]